MGQNRFFSKPSDGVEIIGKFAGETGSRAASAKGFTEHRLLQERLTLLLSLPPAPLKLTGSNSKDKCHAEHKTHGQTPSERAAPGACPGSISRAKG